MKKYNVIVIFDKDFRKTLMCKRTKEPYKGMYNLVGGKIEKENDGLNEAYRELQEETNISSEDISLIHFMNMEYIVFDKMIEVYYGILNNAVDLVEEVNKLEWVDVNDNFFDIGKYVPKRKGYTFLGWCYKPTAYYDSLIKDTSNYDWVRKCTDNGFDRNLYAKWAEDSDEELETKGYKLDEKTGALTIITDQGMLGWKRFAIPDVCPVWNF